MALLTIPKKPPVPEKPPEPPLDDLAHALAHLVKTRHRRYNSPKSAPLHKPIVQAARLAEQRKREHAQAASVTAQQQTARAQRTQNAIQGVQGVVELGKATGKLRHKKPAEETPAEETEQTATPAPATPATPATPGRRVGHLGFRKPMIPTGTPPAGTPTGPRIATPAEPAPITRSRPAGRMGPVVGTKRPIVLQGRPRKRKSAAPGMLGTGPTIPVETERPTLEQLHREAGITPDEGMKPAAPVKPRGIRPRKPRDASDTQATQTQSLPPMTSLPSTRKPAKSQPSIADQPTVLAPQPSAHEQAILRTMKDTGKTREEAEQALAELEAEPKLAPGNDAGDIMGRLQRTDQEPVEPPQRGEPTPRRGRFETLRELLMSRNWHGFTTVAERREAQLAMRERNMAAAEHTAQSMRAGPTLEEQLARLKSEQGDQGGGLAAGYEGAPDVAALQAAKDAQIAAETEERMAKLEADNARIREHNAKLAAMSPRQRAKAVAHEREKQQAEEMKRRRKGK